MMRSDRFLNASIAMKTATLALVLVAANALADERAPEPTVLEEFVADPAKGVRGLRLTMEDDAGSDSVHLDESQVAALKDDLASVAQVHRNGPDWTRLLLAAHGGRAFEFPDRRPVELAMLIDQLHAAVS